MHVFALSKPSFQDVRKHVYTCALDYSSTSLHIPQKAKVECEDRDFVVDDLELVTHVFTLQHNFTLLTTPT